MRLKSNGKGANDGVAGVERSLANGGGPGSDHQKQRGSLTIESWLVPRTFKTFMGQWRMRKPWKCPVKARVVSWTLLRY